MRQMINNVLLYLIRLGLKISKQTQFTVIEKQTSYIKHLKFSETFRDLDEDILKKMFTVKKKTKFNFQL